MVIFRVFINLFFKISRALVYPISVIRKHAFLLIVLCAIIYVYTLFSGSDDGSSAPATNQNAAKGAPRPKPPGNIQPVAKYEDGNSIFSADLLPAMEEEELRQYSFKFYWVMDNVIDGEAHKWDFFNIHGTITPTATFVNNLGDTCRRFDELLKVHETQQQIAGIACQQKGGGWCKLRPNSTPACDLGRKGGISDWWFDTKRNIGDWFK